MANHQSLVVRLLNTPDIAAIVPQLSPQVLHRVIEHCGLEECAEIVALATPAQIERVLDVDLWRPPTPGRDELFDAARFGDWLEVLMQAGEDVAADKLAALDLDLVVAGFSRHVLVFDLVAATPYTTLDGEQVGGRALDGPDTMEIGGFLVEARRTAVWDAVVGVLTSLNAAHPDHFRRLMRACVALSNGAREEDASHNLLDDRGQNAFDLASAREARRDAMGYVTPADARAFLQSARQLRLDRAQPPPDPLAQAYFRTLAAWTADEAAPPAAESPAADAPAANAGIEAVMEVLHDAGVLVHPRALLTAGDAGATRLSWVREHLESHPSSADDLAYLTNLMMAGGVIQERAFTAQEASAMVAATCNLGLEAWPRNWTEVSLVAAFQVGWTILHRDVCLFAAKSLADTLAKIQHPDRQIQLMLRQLRRELIRHGKAGAPWRARNEFDAIMMLDTASWIALLAMIDETPALHRATGPARHSLHTADPADFEFISDNNGIRQVRDFLTNLKNDLSA